jgi:hypothetical protein
MAADNASNRPSSAVNRADRPGRATKEWTRRRRPRISTTLTQTSQYLSVGDGPPVRRWQQVPVRGSSGFGHATSVQLAETRALSRKGVRNAPEMLLVCTSVGHPVRNAQHASPVPSQRTKSPRLAAGACQFDRENERSVSRDRAGTVLLNGPVFRAADPAAE